MGKKQQQPKPEPDNSKGRPGRTNKTRNKEMFAQLKTHEENKVTMAGRSLAAASKAEEMLDEQDSLDYSNVDVENAGATEDLEKICMAVHHLIAKNKINAKNAFDVPLIDIEKLNDFQRISQSDNGWSRISSTLENDAKIFSYRVDAIHSIAYRIVNTMTRNMDQEGGEKSQSATKNDIDNHDLNKRAFPITDDVDITMMSQLEKNIDNLNMQPIDKMAEFNPTYERTRRRFDQSGLRGLLLNNIQMDSNMELSLNETRKSKPIGLYFQSMPVNVDRLKEPFLICKKIEEERHLISILVQQEFQNSLHLQKMLEGALRGDFSLQLDPLTVDDNQMDVQNQGRMQGPVYKKVEDAIKMKNKKIKSATDIATDGLSWLSEMDRKMLGIEAPSGNVPTSKKMSNPSRQQQRNEDDVEFDAQSTLSRLDVFTQSTTQRQKQEYNQQIEQKHLLPLRLFHKFKVQQTMSLREQPPQVLVHPCYDDQPDQQEEEKAQIDLKWQQVSIRDSKERLKAVMKKQMDFKSLCGKFQIAQREVSPELCFLTVLHLANQNNLLLQQIDDYNFKIKS